MNGRIGALFLLLAVLAACGAAPGATPPAAADPLAGTAWVLEQLRGRPPLAGADITMEFTAGRVGGAAGCNHYGGAYEARGDRLTVGGLAVTEMYCADPAGVMEQEQAFLAALSAAVRFRAAAGRLELLDDAGQVLLALVPPPPAPEVALEGTEWTLTTLLEGETAAAVLGGTTITLRLEQGRLGGTAGCNSYGGDYTREGDTLAVGTLVRTLMLCADPPGVMEQEDRYLELLQGVTALELAAGRLTLRAADGSGLVLQAR